MQLPRPNGNNAGQATRFPGVPGNGAGLPDAPYGASPGPGRRSPPGDAGTVPCVPGDARYAIPMLDLDGIDAEVHAARRARLAKRLGAEGPTVLLGAGAPPPRNYTANVYDFRASSHFLYFVGAPLERGMALLAPTGACTVFVPPPDADDALWHGPQPDPAALGAVLGCDIDTLDALPAALRGADRVVGVAPADAASQGAMGAALGRAPVDPNAPADDTEAAVVDAIVAVRLIHDEAAVESLRAAAEATGAAHEAGMRATRPGLREWAVVAAMEHQFRLRGMTTSYPPIVTTRGEVLHNHAHHHVLAHGDLLLADVGAETRDGWAGDVTRTWPVSGTYSATQRAIYEVVLGAQGAAIEAVRPGARYRDVHLTAARALTRGLVDLGILRGDVDELVAEGVPYLFFPHGVGHLIGQDVHDMEDLGDRAGYAPGRTRSKDFGLANLRLDRDLLPGMAVTIEPGFYQVPGILGHPDLGGRAGDRIDRDTLARFADVRGIRIEDDVLVTGDGADVLTAGIPKAPDDVEGLVGADPGAADGLPVSAEAT